MLLTSMSIVPIDQSESEKNLSDGVTSFYGEITMEFGLKDHQEQRVFEH